MKAPSAPLASDQFAAFAPLKFFLAYLAITLALAIWGPIQYYQFPIGRTLLFMGAVMVAIAAGYTHGVRIGLKTTDSPSPGGATLVRHLFDWSLAISFIALAAAAISAAASGQLNTDFTAIGDTYLSAYEGYERNTGVYSLDFIIYSISLPFNFIATIWGFYYFSSLGKTRKVLVVVLAVSTLLFYVLGSGKQKQLGDILIYLAAVAALKYGVRRKPLNIRFVLAVSFVAVLGLLALVAVLGQRYDALGVNSANVNRRVLDLIYIDTNHPLFWIFGSDYGLSLALFLTYLSQGYYGLGLALTTDWSWTYFLGFSYSISVFAERLFGLEWQWPNTLVSQVGATTGWNESKWHTVFTHFATDFTFPGTVLLFGFFAYVYARSWRAATRFQNPFAILMFAQLTMGAFFMPANNQLLHSPGALLTTIVISILYISQARRFNVLAPATSQAGQVRHDRAAHQT